MLWYNACMPLRKFYPQTPIPLAVALKAWPRADIPLLTRFMSFVEYKDGHDNCWEWAGYIHPEGYGRFGMGRKRLVPSNLSVRWSGREIPDGYDPDHLCRNRKCIRPSHLEVVTKKVNILRGCGPTAINSRKTHCIRGHPLTGSNVQWDGESRHCKTCHLATARKHYENNKQRITDRKRERRAELRRLGIKPT